MTIQQISQRRPASSTPDGGPDGRPRGVLLRRVRADETAASASDRAALQQRCSTIGSHPQCTVVVPNLAPVHALVIRGRHRTVVRRWLGPARLNDVPIDDALLQPGDLLKLADTTWVIEATEAASKSPPQPPGEQSPPQPPGTSDRAAAAVTDRVSHQIDWLQSQLIVAMMEGVSAVEKTTTTTSAGGRTFPGGKRRRRPSKRRRPVQPRGPTTSRLAAVTWPVVPLGLSCTGQGPPASLPLDQPTQDAPPYTAAPFLNLTAESQLQAASDRIALLEQTLDKIQHRLAQLTEKPCGLTDHNDQLAQQNTQLASQTADLAAQQQLSRQRDEFARQHSELAEPQDQLLKQPTPDLDQQRAQLLRDYQTLCAAVELLRHEQQESADLIAALEQSLREVSTLRDDVARWQQRVQRQEDQLGELTAQMAQLRAALLEAQQHPTPPITTNPLGRWPQIPGSTAASDNHMAPEGDQPPTAGRSFEVEPDEPAQGFNLGQPAGPGAISPPDSSEDGNQDAVPCETDSALPCAQGGSDSRFQDAGAEPETPNAVIQPRAQVGIWRKADGDSPAGSPVHPFVPIEQTADELLGPTPGATGGELPDKWGDQRTDGETECGFFVPSPHNGEVDLEVDLHSKSSGVAQGEPCDFEVPVDSDQRYQTHLGQTLPVFESDSAPEKRGMASSPVPAGEPQQDWPRDEEPEGAGTSEADEAELAVQEYMARLLRRLRSGEAYETPHEETRQPSPPETPLAWDQPTSEKAAPILPDEYTPRSVAPERHVDLRAMRELALHSARSALANHATRSSREKTRRLLSYAALAAIAAGIGWLLPNHTWPWMRHLAVGAGIVLSGLLLTVALAMQVRHRLHGGACASRTSA